MKLTSYLRFLRPLRSLLVIAQVALLAFAWAKFRLHQETHVAAWHTLVIAVPLMLGLAIAGATHEPLHRPFALLLPRLRQRQRTAATLTLLAASVLIAAGARWFEPGVATMALFGFIGGLMALPCLNWHQWLGRTFGGLAVFFIWYLLSNLGFAQMTGALNAFPALFLAGGLLIATASLLRGFSRASLRARTDYPFIALQTQVFSNLLRRGPALRWSSELAAQNQRRKKASTTQTHVWTIRSVGPSTLDWMRVMWHASNGSLPRGSFPGLLRTCSIMTVIYAAVLAGFGHAPNRPNYWIALAQLASPEADMFAAQGTSGVVPLAMLLQPVMAMFIFLQQQPPQLAYPISRARLARAVYGQSLILWVAALVIPVVSILLVSLLGQVVSGHTLPGYGLPALFVADLPLVVLLPLLGAVGTIRRAIWRILATVPLVMSGMELAFSRPHWTGLALSLPGMLTIIGVAALSQWLLWHRLHRDYATTDQVFSTAPSQALAFRIMGSR